ncbi:hypothetical protein QA612_04720 [Evansella sp. AB-P1]|uniref:hypothetical protein n=1 Tax=Evansella sp. AB-P1 TaxID=3037653 RepID=UPI00241CEF1B|nr:hypothetical protein [Evansella sp. AB-P1]MDG5786785.1 hypothetical protein [Evansella sp. AB-P1]
MNMDIDITTISNEMPDFINHDEARQWFKKQFHERFALRNTDTIDGKTIYFYHIIKDLDQYQHYMESFSREEGHEFTNPDTFKSYSTVEITEDGDISLSL